MTTSGKIANPSATGRWLAWLRPNAAARVRLFCFPYAGGGAHIFQAWGRALPTAVEICAINLPGRGARIWETPYAEVGPLVAALGAELRPHLDKPFAFFGHSMGAIVSFECARWLRARGEVLPRRLLVAGCHAPQVPDPKPIHHLPDDEFLAALKELGGVPQEVMENAELMELILPTIRADFTLVETYPYAAQAPLACPIAAFGGTDDDLATRAYLEPWREQTDAGFNLTMLPGNHFFLHSARDLLLEHLSAELRQL